ncbi:MAG: hypothetical protein IPL59_07385 [Candidatus Competibacteraceae bacterium]|nr:hypothetical protein [Candidatus Competibacteraceae bacterium]MBK8753406.1 hypothetical protein [Candidatus Competibacteraceae bacterium]
MKDISVLKKNSEEINVYAVINAKNAYGGYTGYKSYICMMNNNREVVRIFGLEQLD